MVSNFMPLSLRQITSTKYNMICRIATLLALVFIFFVQNTNAQVNAVEFGKNRIQYKKMKWKFYQSKNFNTYVNQGGVELGAFVSKLAEEELPEIEGFIEYSLQRKANIFVYNSYDELRQSNIGLGQDWQNAGGITKLPNNKIVVYFDGNHNNLRIRLRQGIAKALLDNQLFGDDFAAFLGFSSMYSSTCSTNSLARTEASPPSNFAISFTSLIFSKYLIRAFSVNSLALLL